MTTLPMTEDNPRVRASTVCPLCTWFKPRGLVVCWTCYRAYDLPNGNMEAEAKIAAADSRIAQGVQA